jgi:hypothetical protein
MNEGNNGSDSPIKYTVRINSIGDLPGYIVEIIDTFNYKNYTLSGVYSERILALKDADTFINNLSEQDISMFIN